MLALFRRGRLERDLNDELSFHLFMRAQRVDRGPSGDSRDLDVRQFGNVLRIKEQSMSAWTIRWVDDARQDSLHALRSLGKTPGFSVVAVVTLAVGIGASTVGFSVFYGLLFNGLSARDLHRLVVPVTTSPTMAATVGIPYNPTFTLRDFVALQNQSHVFEDMAGYSILNNVVYTDGQHTDQATAAVVTSNALSFYGVPAFIGRRLTVEDGRADAPPVLVMAHSLWTRQFNGDSSLIGKTLFVDSQPRLVVGVMPRGFEAFGAQLWLPIQDSADSARIPVAGFGRLKRGVSIAEANADIEVVIKRVLGASFIGRRGAVNDPEITSARVMTASDYLLGMFGLNLPKGAIYAVFAAVLLLLLIACTNVASLLLARTTSREGELAVRVALGATRARLVRQMLAESCVVSVAACIAGAWLAYLSLEPITSLLLRKGIATETTIDLNPAVLMFAIGAALCTVLISGLASALAAVRMRPGTNITAGSKGTDYRHNHRIRNSYIVAQAALSLVLTVGAGLMLRTLHALTSIDLGFEPNSRLVVGLQNVGRPYRTAEQRQTLMQPIVERLKALPGVANVAVTTALPGYGSPSSPLLPADGQLDAPVVKVDLCDEALVSTLGLRLTVGRAMSAADVSQSRPVALVNETFIRRMHFGNSPIGRSFRLSAYAGGSPLEIIGIVTDVKNLSPRVTHAADGLLAIHDPWTGAAWSADSHRRRAWRDG